MKFSRLIQLSQHSAFKVEMTIETLKSYKSKENGQIQVHLIQTEVKLCSKVHTHSNSVLNNEERPEQPRESITVLIYIYIYIHM